MYYINGSVKELLIEYKDFYRDIYYSISLMAHI